MVGAKEEQKLTLEILSLMLLMFLCTLRIS